MSATSFARRALVSSAIAALALLALVASASAQVRTFDQIIQAKVLRVGVNPTLPLVSSLNERGELVGLEIDLAREIGKLMGADMKVEFVQVSSPDRIPYVSTGRVDVVMGSLTRTPARALVIDFTVPTATQATKLMTVEGRGITSVADINKPTTQLLQVRGTVAIPWIQQNAPQAKLTLLDNYPDVFRAIAQGRGNAIVDVAFGLRTQMKNFPETKWVIVDDVIETFHVGLGIAKGNHTLKDWLNVALYELHRTGFINANWQKWYGEPMTALITPNPFF